MCTSKGLSEHQAVVQGAPALLSEAAAQAGLCSPGGSLRLRFQAPGTTLGTKDVFGEHRSLFASEMCRWTFWAERGRESGGAQVRRRACTWTLGGG